MATSWRTVDLSEAARTGETFVVEATGTERTRVIYRGTRQTGTFGGEPTFGAIDALEVGETATFRATVHELTAAEGLLRVRTTTWERDP
jgi:hypothetical protein